MLSHKPFSNRVVDDVARLGQHSRLAQAHYESGVPIHSAIYDHPSSHATSVIWLRIGMLSDLASDNDQRPRHRAIHHQPPVSESARLKPLELIGRRRDFVGKRLLRDHAPRELARRQSHRQHSLAGVSQRLTGSVNSAAIRREQPVALCHAICRRQPATPATVAAIPPEINLRRVIGFMHVLLRICCRQ